MPAVSWPLAPQRNSRPPQLGLLPAAPPTKEGTAPVVPNKEADQKTELLVRLGEKRQLPCISKGYAQTASARYVANRKDPRRQRLCANGPHHLAGKFTNCQNSVFTFGSNNLHDSGSDNSAIALCRHDCRLLRVGNTEPDGNRGVGNCANTRHDGIEISGDARARRVTPRSLHNR